MVDFGQDRNHPHLGRGFAYIEFSNADEAETAMKHMDGGQIDGQVIQIFFQIDYLSRSFIARSYLKFIHLPHI